MNEQLKLDEAKYFSSRMDATRGEPDAFQHHLSAFLSAGRSVLQYALAEATQKPGGQSWYERAVSNSRVIRFFKDKRDTNTHVQPIRAKQDTQTQILHRDAPASFFVNHPEIQAEAAKRGPDATVRQAIKVSQTRYTFSDWPVDRDVSGLCGSYLMELEKLILHGQKAGFLT